jgi:DNA polymerase-3 subunit gamma/tau
MSHLALARKWRPQRFGDVIGQKGAVDTLRNAISSGRLAQSFIFSGPRGVGKTTTARILARALNCTQGPTPDPCGTCDACREIAEGRDVDVLEIDAATHTGVDAVRQVIVEPLSIAPMRDRFKVFIIDEVHRLSAQAFDALLKSIEEPPPHVKFMMATTELGKVPATIQSRSQIFELRALPFTAIRDQLRDVAGREKIAIDEPALALVARFAEGSMRDALSALDQVLAFTSDKVTAADVSAVLGLIGRDAQFEIVEIVAAEDAGAAFDAAGRIVEAGYDLRIVCRELARLMRDLLIVKIDASRLSDPEIAAETERDRMQAIAARFSREDLMRAFDLLTRAESAVRYSSQPRHQFEMTLLEWIHLGKLTELTELLSAASGLPAEAPRAKAGAAGLSAEAPRAKADAPSVSSAAAKPASVSSPGADPSSGPDPSVSSSGADPSMPSVTSSIRAANKTFYSMVVAQAQQIDLEGDALVFTFAPAHRALRAQLESKRAWLEQVVQAPAGRKLRIVVKDSETPAAAPGGRAGAAPADSASAARAAGLRERAKSEPTVQAVLDVFGGEIDDVQEVE